MTTSEQRGSGPMAALDILARAPGLAGAAWEQVEVAALQGLTNATYRVDTRAGCFAVQMPDRNGAPDMARAHAIAATQHAHAIGVGAELVHVEESSGAIVTRWVAATRPADAEVLRARPGGVAALASCIARLHRSEARLARRFDPFAAIAELASRSGAAPLASHLAQALSRAETELARTLRSEVPVHGDLVPANVLAAPDGFVLIDWDYAGMGDPAWDIAYFALEAGLTLAEERVLADAHGGPGLDVRRLRLNRMVAATLAWTWGAARMRVCPVPDLSAWIDARRAESSMLATGLYASGEVG